MTKGFKGSNVYRDFNIKKNREGWDRGEVYEG